ncbi:MAG: cytochrome d ubiquinol oxidase subunit II [Candidatus Sumerlaeota bacterium]|nr:cytochrome d ubiquinol oxidase subunit II [Candidatus Sumerlaeota bacterium]
MDLNTIWFILVGVLLTGYGVLDGFDLGAGVLSLFARDEKERRTYLNAIGPVWDGNEVWLLTGGGAMFAAFPAVYATVFEGFYLALTLLLLALIARAVSFEFRKNAATPAGRRLWEVAFGIGSLLPAILLGVAFGNILRGVPIEKGAVWAGSFLGLLNPYAVLMGVLSLALFVMHGAIYMTLKTDGELQARMKRWALACSGVFAALYAVATAATLIVPSARLWIHAALANPLGWLLLLIFLLALGAIPLCLGADRKMAAFCASSLTILAMMGLAGVGLYPNMVPSLIAAGNNLTITNASSSPLTLKVMLVIALVGMPAVIVYQAWIHRIFRGRVEITEESY